MNALIAGRSSVQRMDVRRHCQHQQVQEEDGRRGQTFRWGLTEHPLSSQQFTVAVRVPFGERAQHRVTR